MYQLKLIYRYFTWLSGDVVVGAMAGMLFFERLLRTHLDWQVYGILAVSVWCVYTLDHLLDSRLIRDSSIEDRHSFHAKNSRILWILLFVGVLAGIVWAYVSLKLSRDFLTGAGLACIILLLILGVRRLASYWIWLKESGTAVFYVIGISFLPMLRTDSSLLSWKEFILLLIYVLLAYLNLLMLSWLDRAKDKQSGFRSTVSIIPDERARSGIRSLALTVICLSLGTFILYPSLLRIYTCLLMMMGLVHYLVFFESRLSSGQMRIRLEASFMIPMVLALI